MESQVGAEGRSRRPDRPAKGLKDGRPRLRLERRHRRRLDGAGLLARRDAGLHRRGRRASACRRRRSCSLSFVPMLLIASAYYYMNRADPDCGTTFSWVTRAMGPRLGWLGGWAIIVADIIVMANLAQIAGLYTFLLFGWDSAAESTSAVTASASLDRADDRDLLHRHRAVRAHAVLPARRRDRHARRCSPSSRWSRCTTGNAGPNAVDPASSWFNPFEIDASPRLISGVLLARVHLLGLGQHGDRQRGEPGLHRGAGQGGDRWHDPARLIYVIVSIAAQAYGGPKTLIDNADDVLSVLGTQVFGSPLDKILIIAVLTSAAASTQTTILPTARTSLSMARAGAMPRALGAIHPRYLTPHVSTILMGVLSIVWYVGLTIVSREHPVRLDRRARPDDRLLLRAHRLRLRDLLPPRAVPQRQELPADRRRRRRSAA